MVPKKLIQCSERGLEILEYGLRMGQPLEGYLIWAMANPDLHPHFAVVTPLNPHSRS